MSYKPLSIITRICLYRKVAAILWFFILHFSFSNCQSIYTTNIDTIVYNPLDSAHFLIQSKNDWSHINDSNKRFFFVKPNNNYGRIYIYADGTELKKRHIFLLNNNNTHPGKLDFNNLANVQLIFDSAHFWVVDRMSCFNSDEEPCFNIKNHSSNIVLNRLYITNFYEAIRVCGSRTPPYTNNITIQNSRIDRMTDLGIDHDKVAILLTGDLFDIDRTLINTKILNNEIKNCNDGVQLIQHPDQGHKVNYAGTIIDCNHIYVDNTVYTEGNGNRTPDGDWALTENAIDLKGGSEDIENPIIISNNYMWGFKRTDTNGGGSGSWGQAIDAQYNVKNLVIRNNVFFNSNRSLAIATTADLPFSIENAYIIGNIMYNIGYLTTEQKEIANYFYNSKNIKFQKNTIVGVDKNSQWFRVNDSEKNLDVSCNVVINSHVISGDRTNSTNISFNFFYDTEVRNENDGEFFIDASSAMMKDMIFTTDRYTKEPRVITIPGVVTTENSPHYNSCFSSSVTEIDMLQNYPNPFVESTTIEYSLPENTYVDLSAYSLNGQKIYTIVSKQQPTGRYRVLLNSSDISPGLYYYKLITERSSLTRKMILLLK